MTTAEIIQVEFRESNNGIAPLRFILHGELHTVLDIGRKWADMDGQHFLVMAAEYRIFELIYQPVTMQWCARPIDSKMIAMFHRTNHGIEKG